MIKRVLFVVLLITLISYKYVLAQMLSMQMTYLRLKYAQTENKVILNWETPDWIKNSLKHFEIYRDDKLLKTTQDYKYEDENLQPGIYKYYVKAIFSNGNFVKSDDVYITISIPQTTTEAQQSEIQTTTTTTTSGTTTSNTTTTTTSVTTSNTISSLVSTTSTIVSINTTTALTKEKTKEEKIKLKIKSLPISPDIISKTKIFITTEKDGLKEIETDDKGEVLIELSPNQKIMINGVSKIDNKLYKSINLNFELSKEDKNINLYLEPKKELPKHVEIEIKASQENKITLEDNTEIKIPAQAIKEENIKVEIEPVVSLPPVTNVSVIGLVYDVNILDVQNNPIKQFNKEIEIKIPYDENELKNQGLTEDSIAIGYYDENLNKWIPLQKFIVDKVNNIVIGYIQHLTKFAIIAFADKTPPKPPTNVKIRLIAENKVKISWINPREDFKYIRIYRSLEKDQIGSLYFDNVTSTEIIDDNIQRGKTYYYLVKSVDYAGNESLNSKPVEIKIPTFKFTRYLKRGMRGNDVIVLQEILIQEGVYPKKLVSGYFDKATYQAVIRFQEKYKDEILKPWNLDTGTGFVGPTTIKKLNQLITK